MVGQCSELDLPAVEVAESMANELSLPGLHGLDDSCLSIAQGVRAELLEERLEAQLHETPWVVVAEHQVGEERQGGAEPLGVRRAEPWRGLRGRPMAAAA